MSVPHACAVDPGCFVHGGVYGGKSGQPQYDIVSEIFPYVAEHKDIKGLARVHPVDGLMSDLRQESVDNPLICKEETPKQYD